MKVKVGDRVYDGEKEPVMVILSDQEKQNITNMASDNMRYCAYPDGMDNDAVYEWMGEV